MDNPQRAFDDVADWCERHLEGRQGLEVGMTFGSLLRTYGRLASLPSRPDGEPPTPEERDLNAQADALLTPLSNRGRCGPLECLSVRTNMTYDTVEGRSRIPTGDAPRSEDDGRRPDRPRRRPAVPAARAATVLSFVACEEVSLLPGDGPPRHHLSGPCINIWSHEFPADVRLGLFAEFTGAVGIYVPRVELCDEEGEIVARLAEGGPFRSGDPVAVHCVAIERVGFEVPGPGRYDLVLRMNGEEAARRQLWVRPPEAGEE
jgi:hypothetical protein